MKGNSKKDTSWGNVAGWYDELVLSPDSYQQKVILPNLERVLGVSSKDSVLDIACGQGLFAHVFAKRAKSVSGFDISSELVSIAEREKGSNETFKVALADESFPFDNSFFDIAYCILALQNIKNIDKTFGEVTRVLKVGGKFVFVINHPSFRIPKEADWGFDESTKKQYRKVYSYMSEKTVPIEMHPGKDKSDKTVSFHRPLQYFVKLLSKQGLVVTRLEEWISHRESQKGPRQVAEDQARKEIPLFMMIECKKL